MLTDEDIQKIIEANRELFPSKGDFEVFGRETKENFNGLRDDLNNFKKETRESFAKLVTLEEFDMSRREIEQDFSNLRESVNNLTNSIDKLVKAVSDLKTEYTAITYKIDRHENWLHQLAEKLNIKLEY